MRMLVQGHGSPLQPLLLLMLLLLHHHQQQQLLLLLQVATGAPIAAGAAAAKDPTAPAPEVPSSPFSTLKYKAFSVQIYGLRLLSLPLWSHRRLLPIALGFSRPHVNQHSTTHCSRLPPPGCRAVWLVLPVPPALLA